MSDYHLYVSDWQDYYYFFCTRRTAPRPWNSCRDETSLEPKNGFFPSFSRVRIILSRPRQWNPKGVPGECAQICGKNTYVASCEVFVYFFATRLFSFSFLFSRTWSTRHYSCWHRDWCPIHYCASYTNPWVVYVPNRRAMRGSALHTMKISSEMCNNPLRACTTCVVHCNRHEYT